MPYFRVNVMGGFRVSDMGKVLSQDEVYQFTDVELSESKGLSAAIRNRWLVETDDKGRPLNKSKVRRRSASRMSKRTAGRKLAQEAEVYPAKSDYVDDEQDELDRVTDEEMALRFNNPEETVADEPVATPMGMAGGREARVQRRSARKTSKPRAKKKPTTTKTKVDKSKATKTGAGRKRRTARKTARSKKRDT